MKLNITKTLNQPKVQIVKHVFVFALSFLALANANAQNNNHRIASAIITANIVTDMVGATQFEDMKFSGLIGNKTTQTQDTISKSSASFNIISNSYAYEVTVPSENILLTKKGTTDTMQLGSFNSSSSKVGLSGNEERIIITASIIVAGSQTSGEYTAEAPLAFTVNYN